MGKPPMPAGKVTTALVPFSLARRRFDGAMISADAEHDRGGRD
jgi:hypothetical protein